MLAIKRQTWGNSPLLFLVASCSITSTLGIPFPHVNWHNVTTQDYLNARALLYTRADTTPAADTYPGGAICSAYKFGKNNGIDLRQGTNYNPQICGYNGLKYDNNDNPTALVDGFQETPFDRQCDHVLELQTILPWIFDTLTVTGFNTFCQTVFNQVNGGSITAATIAGQLRLAVNIPQNLHSIPEDVNQLKGKLWQGQTSYSYDYGRLTIESYINLIRPAASSIVTDLTNAIEAAYPGHGLNSAAAVADLNGRFTAKLDLMEQLVQAANIAQPPVPRCQANSNPPQATTRDVEEEATIHSWAMRSLLKWKRTRSLEPSAARSVAKRASTGKEQDDSDNTSAAGKQIQMEKRSPAAYWVDFCDDNGDNCSSAFDIWNPGCFSVDGTTVSFHGDPFATAYNLGAVTLVVSPDGGCPCQSSSQDFNVIDADTNTPYKLDKTGRSYRFVANDDTGNNCPSATPPTTSIPTPTTNLTPTPTSDTTASSPSPTQASNLQTAPDPGEAADNVLPPEGTLGCSSSSSSSSTSSSSSSTTTSSQSESQSSPEPTQTDDSNSDNGGEGFDFPDITLPGGFNLPGFHLPSIPGPGGISISDPFGHTGILKPGPGPGLVIIQSGSESSTVSSLPSGTSEPSLSTITTTDSNGQPTTLYSAQASPSPTPTPTPPMTSPVGGSPVTLTSTEPGGSVTVITTTIGSTDTGASTITTTTTGADGLPTVYTTLTNPPPSPVSTITTSTIGIDGLPTVITTTVGTPSPAPGSPVTSTLTGADGLPTIVTTTLGTNSPTLAVPAPVSESASLVTVTTTGIDGLPTIVTSTVPDSATMTAITTTGADGVPTILTTAVGTPSPSPNPTPGSVFTVTTTGVDGLPTVTTSTSDSTPVSSPASTPPAAPPAGSGTFAKFCSDGQGDDCTQSYDLTQTTCFTIPDVSAAFITFYTVTQPTTDNENYSLVVSPDAACACQNNVQTVPIAVFNASQTTNLQFTGGSYHWVAGAGTPNTC